VSNHVDEEVDEEAPVPDIHRANPVGDKVNNIDEIPTLMFTPTFKANYFYSRNSKAC
jgi:hypothetical protein